jgi:hypothetical protein
VRRTLMLLTVLIFRQAAAQEPSLAETRTIPTWAADVLRDPNFTKEYALSTRLHPFLLQGDFNGDGALDVAILVSRRGTGARGIALLHAGSTRPELVGAGHATGDGGEDFSWMDAWSVYPKGAVHRGADGSSPPRLRGDALLVEKLESASAIIYWDGAGYRWYQQGD